MKVRFARWLAFGIMALGAVPLVAGVVLIVIDQAEGGIPALLAGLALAGFGAAYLGPLPYFIVTPREVIVPTMRGRGARTALGRRDRLDLTGSRLVVVRSADEHDRLPIYRRMAHPDDWNALVDAAVSRKKRAKQE